MVKKTILILLFILITLLACVHDNSSNKDEYTMIRVVIYELSTGAYLFELNSNGKLRAIFGDGFTDSNTNLRITNTAKDEIKIISENEFAQLLQKINGFPDFEVEQGMRTYGRLWRVVIEYENKTHRFIYGRSTEKVLDELVSMLIEVSPFEVVDYRGDIIFPQLHPE